MVVSAAFCCLLLCCVVVWFIECEFLLCGDMVHVYVENEYAIFQRFRGKIAEKKFDF